jgi:hypothetical protein
MPKFGRWLVTASVSAGLVLYVTGCPQTSSPDTTNDSYGQGAQQYPADNPASANLAPVSNASDNTGAPPSEYQTPQAQQQYASSSNQPDPYAAPYPSDSNYDENYDTYEPPAAYAPEPPPELPEYQQPPCPGDNYIWTPGYWDYAPGQGYYWVPGVWVMAPYEGALWTPGWWGFDRDRYGWHRGYWGRHEGYYGGVDYGYGYDGYGYEGGYWRGDRFAYNRVVNNVDPSRVHDIYAYRFRAANNTRISYNGGRGGVRIRPRPAEVVAMHEQHNAPLAPQRQLALQARNNHQNFARVDHGRPAQPVVTQPLRAENNVRPPEVRNPGAIAPPRARPGQARNIPPPQPGHYTTNVEPQPGGPRVGEQARLMPGGAPPNGNGREAQGRGTPVHQMGPNGIPVRAVGPEPAVPRNKTQYQPRQAEPYRPMPAPERGGIRQPAAPRAEPRPPAEQRAPVRPSQQNRAPAPRAEQHSAPNRQPPRRPDQRRPQ